MSGPRPKFRQEIRPGQSGRDVKAVKLAYRKYGVAGSGALNTSKKAGPQFVKVTKTFQRHHPGLKVDGWYGEATHEALIRAIKWSPYMVYLYKSAAMRQLPPHPEPNLDTVAAAKKLEAFYATGQYRDDHYGEDIAQIRRAAQGLPVWSQGGFWVHFDKRVFDALIYIIEKGHKVGTFALCSDHHFDSTFGHAGGHAVDISSIDGISVNRSTARAKVIEVLKEFHAAHGLLPWQLISGGYGNHLDAECEALTIPSAGFYGIATMLAHTNHIHDGYLP